MIIFVIITVKSSSLLSPSPSSLSLPSPSNYFHHEVYCRISAVYQLKRTDNRTYRQPYVQATVRIDNRTHRQPYAQTTVRTNNRANRGRTYRGRTYLFSERPFLRLPSLQCPGLSGFDRASQILRLQCKLSLWRGNTHYIVLYII